MRKSKEHIYCDVCGEEIKRPAYKRFPIHLGQTVANQRQHHEIRAIHGGSGKPLELCGSCFNQFLDMAVKSNVIGGETIPSTE
jgi:hypothetical protein